jgi:serine/threonine protein kinase
LKEKNTLDNELIVEYIKQILDALSFIHSKRLVHRDIKPDNILLNKDGTLVKVSDFGISKDLDYSSSDSIQGAFLYMSPEQLTDPSKVDHRSDFYSLAVVIYQLKTGEIPFLGTITNIIDGKRFKSLPKTNSFLDPIIQKASKKNPAERYSNANEFKHDLVKLYEKSSKRSSSSFYWVYVLILISFLSYVFKDDILSAYQSINQTEKMKNSSVNNVQKINTIELKNQIWMVDNLTVKRFKYGTPIFEALNKEDWDRACKNRRPAYCHVDNDPSNDAKYGLLYNWYAVTDSICPDGYEIPKKEDFDILASEHDFSSLPNEFRSILPGYRSTDGYYLEFNNGLIMWSKNEKYGGCVYALKIFKTIDQITIGEQKPSDCYSIRCIKKR